MVNMGWIHEPVFTFWLNTAAEDDGEENDCAMVHGGVDPRIDRELGASHPCSYWSSLDCVYDLGQNRVGLAEAK
ncbi:hypothetical protein DM01DRAFT_1373577 [Hesseltinella vesiculosa]|uniref:Uncharacterized protein n=1 Tax=Hesseltinella vesiculosa TaxID=101127 RepID=A0A1X2GIW6_9FUNG|nr:hypothetical protein DM01DRAFT_1373577 [Hesseltinella vesiculosa]